MRFPKTWKDVRDLKSEAMEYVRKEYSGKSVFGVVIILVLAVPEWKGALDFWAAFHWKTIGTFLLTPLGRILLGIVGFVIIAVDHRAVKMKREAVIEGGTSTQAKLYRRKRPNLTFGSPVKRKIRFQGFNDSAYEIYEYGKDAVLLRIHNEPQEEDGIDVQAARARLKFFLKMTRRKETSS